jgi:hypothetical protein
MELARDEANGGLEIAVLNLRIDWRFSRRVKLLGVSSV